MTPEEKDNALFSGLVLMFQGAAMQSLGKTMNPSTEKVEKNLEQAQSMIDMLDMLEKKSKGNLSHDEERFLRNVIQQLKLNYVDEISKEQSGQKESS
jgi:ribosome recycling factor